MEGNPEVQRNTFDEQLLQEGIEGATSLEDIVTALSQPNIVNSEKIRSHIGDVEALIGKLKELGEFYASGDDTVVAHYIDDLPETYGIAYTVNRVLYPNSKMTLPNSLD